MAAAEKLTDKRVATPVSFEIDLTHVDGALEIRTLAVVRNDSDVSLDTLIFNLNPGLESRFGFFGRAGARFREEIQIIDIRLPEALSPDRSIRSR